MYWLDSEPQHFDRVPGAWSAGPDGVEVELGDGEKLTVDGIAVTGRHRFGPVDEEGVRAAYGDAVVEVAARGDDVVLRPRDPASRRLAEHRPTPTFDPAPEWVVPGVLTAAPAGARVDIRSMVDGLTRPEPLAGTVTFEVDGTEHELAALADDDGWLWILFADATSGVTTYGAGRQLSVPPPAPDGAVVLDFNRAVNLPCAYTSFTTCPFPPPGNRLPFAVEAGEQDPTNR
jgi:uncharacterized protein (DUF1684 family)